MSLATRCTHCGTIFKVVQDQLKVSEGWVRCGRCNEVFNALPALFDLDKEPPPPRPVQASMMPPAPPAPPTETPPPPPEEIPAEPTQPEIPPAPPAEVPAPPPAEVPAPPPPEIAPTEPLPQSEPPRALASQSLLSDEEVELGIESQPPSGWERTQPVDFAASTPAPRHTLKEDDLALDPDPIEATTDFELDTSIAVDDNTPFEAVLAAMSGGRMATTSSPAVPPLTASQGSVTPSPSQVLPHEHGHQPWLDEPPEDVPSTDEADALDSRYLMPSERDRRAPRRPGNAPEFADAQFPSDAMLDAEEDWASDFGPSSLESDTPPPAPTLASKLAAAKTKALSTSGLRPAPAPQASQAPSAHSAASVDGLRASDLLSPPVNDKVHHDQPNALVVRDTDGDSDTPEFVKRAQRKAFWRHPAVQASLSVLALGLLLTLGLQLMHQFRDLVAAYHPASRPLLTQWCDMVGCHLAPPLRLEALQVDNLEFVRTSSEGPDSYRLTVVVRNQAPIDLAWPHVDLTLTDEGGATIARKVFSPHDAQWLDTADAKADAQGDSVKAASAAASVPTAAPSQRSTTLQWRLQVAQLRPAGYTAELFYP